MSSQKPQLPTVGQRFLRAATRTTIRLLPKEAKVVVAKYKKYRSSRSSRSSASSTEGEGDAEIMPQKSKTKKNQGQNSNLPVEPQELVEQFKKMSLGDVGTSATTATAKKMEPETVNLDVKEEEFPNDKIRFQKYNIRLEDIVKFREKLGDLEIRHMKIPPAWSRTIDEVDATAKDEVEKARKEAADALIYADNLKDQLDEVNRLKDLNVARVEKYTKELEEQRAAYNSLQQQLHATDSSLQEQREKYELLETIMGEKDQTLADLKEKYAKERDAKVRAEQALHQQKSDAARYLLLKDTELTETIETYGSELDTRQGEIENLIQAIRTIEENFKTTLTRKQKELEEIYNKRMAAHEGRVGELETQLSESEKQIEELKNKMNDALNKNRALEKDNDRLIKELEASQGMEENLRASINEIKMDLEKARRAFELADKELREKEVQFVVDDLQPEFIKYDSLLILEEKRIQTITHRRLVADENNNA